MLERETSLWHQFREPYRWKFLSSQLVPWVLTATISSLPRQLSYDRGVSTSILEWLSHFLMWSTKTPSLCINLSQSSSASTGQLFRYLRMAIVCPSHSCVMAFSLPSTPSSLTSFLMTWVLIPDAIYMNLCFNLS